MTLSICILKAIVFAPSSPARNSYSSVLHFVPLALNGMSMYREGYLCAAIAGPEMLRITSVEWWGCCLCTCQLSASRVIYSKRFVIKS